VAEPPGVPSGFNYTKHKCNKPGPYCGQFTAIGLVNGKYLHERFRCKSYSCGRCGARKIRRVRKRIVQLAVEHDLTRFLTLTLDPKKLPRRCSLKVRLDYLAATWRKMRVYIRRMLGRSVKFIAVVELQENGNPHLHVLVGAYLPKRWITRAWTSLGGGWATRIEHVKVKRVAAYLAKYLTADSLRDMPAGTRRFSTSRGLALFDRSKSEGNWVLVKLPIEYWRERAQGIAVEVYETEQEGARAMASFVADRVEPFLARRFQAGMRMAIEV